MKFSSTVALLSSAALAAAQFSFNAKDNSFACTKKDGLAAYCAGGDIIIRCSNGNGYAGNCNDNLAGEAPFGNNGLAGCYQTSPSSGDAACTKAGLVYPASGSGASRQTAPYPIPGTHAGSKVVLNTRPAMPAGTGIPYPNGTAVSPNANNGHKWSNTTTVTVAPVPAYTAGSGDATTLSTAVPSAGFGSKTPQQYTGAASSPKKSASPYWAFAAFAVVALF